MQTAIKLKREKKLLNAFSIRGVAHIKLEKSANPIYIASIDILNQVVLKE